MVYNKPEKTTHANVKKQAMNVKSKLAKRNPGNIIVLHQAPNRGQCQRNTPLGQADGGIRIDECPG